MAADSDASIVLDASLELADDSGAVWGATGGCGRVQ